MNLSQFTLEFTLDLYKKLLLALTAKQPSFLSFADYIQKFHVDAANSRHHSVKHANANIFILRNDVDRLPNNSLVFARLQHNLGITGSYYFRIVPESFDPVIMGKIADLGHEIGYHYEDLDWAVKTIKNNKKRINDSEIYQKAIVENAIEHFSKNLTRMREFADIRTICMHGSPLSKWDSRLLWTIYNYRDFGIIGEPYFDIDFAKVAYYTDTGRRWDGDRVSRRDKIMNPETQAIAAEKFPRFHTTFDIINTVNSGLLPEQVMFTFHPQRWHDHWLPWTKELVGQNAKNIVKYGLNFWNTN